MGALAGSRADIAVLAAVFVGVWDTSQRWLTVTLPVGILLPQDDHLHRMEIVATSTSTAATAVAFVRNGHDEVFIHNVGRL
jgi:hypothetical protein